MTRFCAFAMGTSAIVALWAIHRDVHAIAQDAMLVACIQEAKIGRICEAARDPVDSGGHR